MNILITGINGFIGTSYATRLRAEGGASVVGIDLQPAASAPCERYIPLDLGSRAAPDVLRGLPGFDFVLHAGGISGLMVETDRPQRIFDVNVAGTMAVLEMARARPPRRLVLCSTIMVYGPDPHTVPDHDESEYPTPISVYGGSKLAQEGLMHAYVGQYGVDAIALRFAHVYGPGRTTECFVRDLLASASAERACHIPQARGSLRQYVHIDDVVDSIVLAMQVASPRSRIFNISADEIHTLEQLAAASASVTGRHDVSFDEGRDLPNYRIGKLSIRRAREALGFRPRWPLSAGLRAYWSVLSTAARSPRTTPGSPPDSPRPQGAA